MISFSIGGTPYQAEEGMTWEQWVNSKYNVETSIYTKFSFDNYSPDVAYCARKTQLESRLYVEGAYKNDKIIANNKYTLIHVGGSN